MKRIGAAAIIRNIEGHVLLVRHSYGKNNWDLPGGKAEADESAQGTAEREVVEETGLIVRTSRLTGVYYDPEYDMHHFVFLAESATEAQPRPMSGEILECRFCDVDELPRPISDFTVLRIRDALSGEQAAAFRTVGPRQWLE